VCVVASSAVFLVGLQRLSEELVAAYVYPALTSVADRLTVH